MRQSIIYHYSVPLKMARLQQKLSERELARRASLSRATIRNIETKNPHLTLSSLVAAAEELGRRINVIASPNTGSTDFECSTLAVSIFVARGENWKLHYMNLVDQFRKSIDPLLLI